MCRFGCAFPARDQFDEASLLSFDLQFVHHLLHVGNRGRDLLRPARSCPESHDIAGQRDHALFLTTAADAIVELDLGPAPHPQVSLNAFVEVRVTSVSRRSQHPAE